MADHTSKTSKHAKDKTKKKAAAGTGGATVMLRNTCSHPVFFRVPGMTVRIGPRGTREIDKSILSTAELGRLCSKKQVTVIEKPTAAPKTAADDATE